MSAAASVRPGWRALALSMGPGLVVMLADTEAGSVIAAAQGGARWGYRLVLPQLLLIPALFLAQALAARLGLVTGQGLIALSARRFGRGVAWGLLATLSLSCLGAVVTELSGIASVGQIFGIPVWQSCAVASIGLLAVVLTGTARSVERVALMVGACELAFVGLALLAHPDWPAMGRELLRLPLGDRGYLYLLAANLGTCVIPWAIFYQQAASVDKGLSRASLAASRAETLAGAVLCQLVTAAVVVAAAAAFGAQGRALTSVGEIADAFSVGVGPLAGHVVFAVGLTGGALVAAIVVCLTVAWSFGEALGWSRLQRSRPAPWFGAVFALVLLGGAATVALAPDLIFLPVAAGVANALLLPVVLLALFLAARRDLPPELRPRGGGAVLLAAVFTLTAALGLYAGVMGLS